MKRMGCSISSLANPPATCVICTEEIPALSREKRRKAASYPSLLGCPYHPCHAPCLRRQLQYEPLQGWCSLQVHDARTHCGVCRSPFTAMMLGQEESLLTPWDLDRKRMEQALLEFVATEFEEDERVQQHEKLRQSQNADYHFCNVCHLPQYVHSGATACTVEVEQRVAPPCPHCYPEKYEVTCANPRCKAKLYVTHGCTTLRCCGHGEHCGHNRMVVDEKSVESLHVASPAPCTHMGGCGFVFQMHPTEEHVRDVGVELDMETIRLVLCELDDTPNPLLVTEYYTRHTLGCTCPACRHQPEAPEAFARLKQRQIAALYSAM